MTVKIQGEDDGKVLTLELSGKLTKEDYSHFTPEVERAVKENGKVRMLVRLNDFHGWTMSALWEDIKFDAHHFSNIERLAIVGENKWEAGMAIFCKPFTTAKVRYFDVSSSEKASIWIHEGIAAQNEVT